MKTRMFSKIQPESKHALVLLLLLKILTLSIASLSTGPLINIDELYNAVSASSLDVCLEVRIDCVITDESYQDIKCDDFPSSSFLTQSSCVSYATLSVNIRNIFNQAVALSYQIDNGAASTVLKQPGETEIVGPLKKSIDLCNVGNFEKLELFHVNIESGWKEESSSLVMCEEMVEIVSLRPRITSSPSTTPSEKPSDIISIRPTSHHTIYSTVTSTEPTTKSFIKPPSSNPIQQLTNQPSEHPILSPSTSGGGTKSPTKHPTSSPTKRLTHQPSKHQFGGSKTHTPQPSSPTHSPVPTIDCSQDELDLDEGLSSPLSIATTPTKKIMSKGKGIVTKKPTLKKKCPTRKGKGGTVTKKITKSPKKSCKKMAKVKIPIPEDSFDTNIYFGIEIFTQKVENTSQLSETIVDGLNNVYKGGLVGCDLALQKALMNEGIVSIEFQNLHIAGRSDSIEGLESLCHQIPVKFKGSKCSKALGSVQIYRLLERRILLRHEQDSVYDILESIFNMYTDSAFEDVDVVLGVHYERLSSNSFALAPQYHNGVPKWGWILPTFIVAALVVSLFIALVFKNTPGENEDERDISALFKIECRHRSDTEFPIPLVEALEPGDSANIGEVAYDYDQICSISSINEEDEILTQRKQLLRTFKFPVVLISDNVDL